MKIFVCIKQVPDTETKIKLNSSSSGIDETGIKWVMNPYDEFAVEEAIKLKEANAGASVVALSLGPKSRIVDCLRTALAMGADEAIAIDSAEALDCFGTSLALANCIKKEGNFSYIFTGKLAIDDNAASVSQMLAEFLNIPHTTVISSFKKDGEKAEVVREVEGGKKEIIQLSGPCVLGANKGLNTPRYASLPGIMKAKKKPLKEVALAELNVDKKSLTSYSKFTLPPEKPPVKQITGGPADQAKALAKLLREEAKVL